MASAPLSIYHSNFCILEAFCYIYKGMVATVVTRAPTVSRQKYGSPTFVTYDHLRRPKSWCLKWKNGGRCGIPPPWFPALKLPLPRCSALKWVLCLKDLGCPPRLCVADSTSLSPSCMVHCSCWCDFMMRLVPTRYNVSTWCVRDWTVLSKLQGSPFIKRWTMGLLG